MNYAIINKIYFSKQSKQSFVNGFINTKILISNHIWNNQFYSSIIFHVLLNPVEKYETNHL